MGRAEDLMNFGSSLGLVFDDPLSFLATPKSHQSVIESELPNPMRDYVPHVKQRMFHEDDSKRRLYIGGNRSGKTVAGALEALWRTMGNHPFLEVTAPPVAGRVVAPDFPNGIAKIILPMLKQWCPPWILRGGSWESAYAKQDRVLHFTNGSTIEFFSGDQQLDKFAGTSRNWTWFDEEPDEDVYNECVLRLLDTDGDAWLTMTPVNGITWTFDRLYLPGKVAKNETVEGVDQELLARIAKKDDLNEDAIKNQANIGVIEVATGENPYLPEGSIDFITQGMSEQQIAIRIRGEFKAATGLIYDTFNPEIHVVKDFRRANMWPVAVSLDHGLNNPVAILWHAISPGGQIVTYSEIYKRNLTVKEVAPLIHERNRALRVTPSFYIADPSIRNRDPITGTSILEEYSRNGIMFSLGNNDVGAGIVRVKGYMTNKMKDGRSYWQTTYDCPNLIWEIGRYRWREYQHRETKNRNNPYEVPRKKDDHAVDALRYFLMSRPELVTMYESPDRNPVNGFEDYEALQGADFGTRPHFEVLTTKNIRYSNWKTYQSDDSLGSNW